MLALKDIKKVILFKLKYPSVFDAKNYIIKYKNFKSKQYHYPLLEYTVLCRVIGQ